MDFNDILGSSTEVKELQAAIIQQRNQITYLRTTAKSCQIDDECSKEELDGWIDNLVTMEDTLSQLTTELSKYTSSGKDGNLDNSNKDDMNGSILDELVRDNEYFHTDGRTRIQVEVFEGKTESNLSGVLLDSFVMKQTDKRVKLAPNTMGVIKFKVDTTITLYKKVKTNGEMQFGSDVLNTAIDAVNFTTQDLTLLPDDWNPIGEIGNISRPSGDYDYSQTDHAFLKGQINVKYTVNEFGEVQSEVLDAVLNQEDGKKCKITFKNFVDSSNLGMVKLQGEVIAKGDYATREAFEYTLEAYSYPATKEEKPEIPEIVFEEDEQITGLSPVCEVYFDFGKHKLDSKELKKLKQWVIKISTDKAWDEALLEKRALIKVVGYASPKGSEEFNERLGKKRADFVWKSIKPQLGYEADSDISSIGGTIKTFGEYDEDNQHQKVIVTIIEK
jgi:outer membrane protein OmpA-like peptidoglycan-associated protein